MSTGDGFWVGAVEVLDDSIGGVTLGAGRAERLRRMLSSYMLCACNYLCIMWMGGGWIGVPVVVCLGMMRILGL